MAETYAFALAGGLLLAMLLSPVLCLLLLPPLHAQRADNFLVRWLKTSYLRQAAGLPQLPLGDLGGDGSLLVA